MRGADEEGGGGTMKSTSTSTSMRSCGSRICRAARRLLVKRLHTEQTLDERMMRFERTRHRAADSSMLFCSRPMQAALTRTSRFHLMLLVMSVMFARMLVGWARRLGSDGKTAHRIFRLSVLETRNGSHPPLTPRVLSFGMLRDEQDVEKALEQPGRVISREMREEEGAVVITYEQQVEVNGFYLVTAEGEGELDPVRFVVYGEEEDGRRTMVGASGWSLDWLRADASSSPPWKLSGSKKYNTTTRRRAVEVFDLRPPRQWTLVVFVLNMFRFLTAFLPLMLGRSGREEEGKLALQTCPFFIGVGVLTLMYLDSSDFVPKLFNLVVVWSLSLLLLLSDREQTFWTGFFLLCAIWGLAGMLLRSSFISTLGVCGSTFSILLLVRRRNLVLESSLLCKKHGREQAKRWKEMMRQEGWKEDLARLEQLASSIMSERQASRRRAAADKGGSGGRGRVYHRGQQERGLEDRFLLCSSAPADAACSLARLYAQAELVKSLLAEKVRGWSSRAGGSIDRGETTGRAVGGPYRKEEEEEEELEILKEEGRAMRCYGGDASRLLDLCRMRVAVKDLKGAIELLQAVREEEDVAVEQIKNRMAGSGSEASGRKDVIVYVRIETEEARRMGVSGLVCEVQVMLQELLLMEGEEERMRYRKDRLLR